MRQLSFNRKFHISKRLARLLVLLAVPYIARGAQTSHYLTCPNDFPVSVGNNDLPIHLAQAEFVTGPDGESAGALEVHMEGNKPVVAMAMAIEFDNEGGQELTKIAYVATTEEAREQLKSPIHTGYVQVLTKPIVPGETVRVQGVSHTVIGVCPMAGKLVFLVLLHSDGSTFLWSMPGWRFGPVPRLLPKGVFFIDPVLLREPMKLVATIEVSPEGRVSRFSAAGNVDARLFQQLRDQVSEWIFFPACEDGNPVSGQLVLLFRIIPYPYGRSPAMLTTKEIVRPLIVILLIQEKERPKEWIFSYGRRGGQTEID